MHVSLNLKNMYKVVQALLCLTVPLLAVDEGEGGPVAFTATRGDYLEEDPNGKPLKILCQ